MQEIHITTTATKQRETGGIEAIYNSETVTTGQESSCEIHRNGKGDLSFTVKVYDADAERAVNDAVELFKYLTIRIREEMGGI